VRGWLVVTVVVNGVDVQVVFVTQVCLHSSRSTPMLLTHHSVDWVRPQ
jgi:hypothetical protein